MLREPDPEWAPLYYTKPGRANATTRGEDIADFARTTMKANRGFKQGEPLELTPWQQWAIDGLLEEKPNGLLKNRRGLIGIPRKNGKSMLGAIIALEALFYGTRGREIYSAAGDRKQARIVFKRASDEVKASPILSRELKVYKDVIENKKTGATYQPLSADGQRAQGLAPYLVIADELHVWTTPRTRDLWAALSEGSGDQEESLVLAITTAGSNLESLLGELYRHGKDIAEGKIKDDSFFFAWWGAPDGADIFDRKTWEQANPNLQEGLYDYEDLEASMSSGASTNIAEFKRYRLNQWVQTAGEQFLPPYFWERIENKEKKLEEGERIVIGFDGSLSEDSTGIVAIGVDTGTIQVIKAWHKDLNDPNWTVNREEVDAEMRELLSGKAGYNVLRVYGDDSYFQTDFAQWATDFYPRVQKIPQSISRMLPMTQEFKADIAAEELTHSGQADLSEHVLNAVEGTSGLVKKERRGSSKKIDLLVCSILANGARRAIKKEESRKPAKKRAIVAY